jgi:hypothetical protein
VKYYEELDKQKRRHLEDNRRILERQMEEEKNRKNIEKLVRRTNDIASYGPIETEDIAKLLKEKKLVEQENMKSILMEQMQNKADLKTQQKQDYLEMEKANLDKVNVEIDNQKERAKENESNQK